VKLSCQGVVGFGVVPMNGSGSKMRNRRGGQVYLTAYPHQQ